MVVRSLCCNGTETLVVKNWKEIRKRCIHTHGIFYRSKPGKNRIVLTSGRLVWGNGTKKVSWNPDSLSENKNTDSTSKKNKRRNEKFLFTKYCYYF